MRSYSSSFLCFNQKLEELIEALKKGRGKHSREKQRTAENNKSVKE